MAELLTLALVKSRLGLESTDDTYDAAITAALPLVTQRFESYCDRALAQRTITEETLYSVRTRRVYLWAFPITVLTTVNVDGVSVAGSSYVVNGPDGYFMPGNSRGYIEFADVMKVAYTGGYAPASVPDDLADAFANAVGVEAAVSVNGVAVSATTSAGSSAIKSIGLGGGALSVAFDTGTVSGGTSGTFDVSHVPPEVQSYASVLNSYMRMNV